MFLKEFLAKVNFEKSQQTNVGPDLDPNRLQRLSADDKIAASKQRVNGANQTAWMFRLIGSFTLHIKQKCKAWLIKSFDIASCDIVSCDIVSCDIVTCDLASCD